MSDQRKTDLASVLFPVADRPVYYLAERDEGIRVQEADTGQSCKPTERFRAIVDVERQYTFAVVGKDYTLVTNKEAIELGRECFQRAFSQLAADEMEVFHIITPATRSFCHIDFTHRDGGFEPWPEDRWVPFLRITNSYNRTRVLSFHLGFCRWICTNGMIFGGKSVQVRYQHTRGQAGRRLELGPSFREFRELEVAFIEQVHNLKRYYVPSEVMLGLACKVFEVRPTTEDLKNPKRRDRFRDFREQISKSTEEHFRELGPNGYAALNVLTDFASRPRLYVSPASAIDRLQRRSGDWVEEFIAEIERKDFTFERYLGDAQRTAELLAS
jgi:hypothetical protein